MDHERSSRNRLLDLLNAGEELSLQEIMDHLGLGSARHVRRLLHSIRDEGFPLQAVWRGRVKKFSLPERDRRLPVRMIPLTKEQVLALTVAAEASRAALVPTPLGGSLEGAFRALLKEISAHHLYSFDLDEEGGHWHFGSSNSVVLDPSIFGRLMTAIQECRRVRIDYLTASTGKYSRGRLVEPYGMAVRNGSWLLVAYCRQKQAMRDFSLAGISSVEFCDRQGEMEFFIRPDDFDLAGYFRPRFNALAGDSTYAVRMLVEPDRAEYFRRKSYHPTQKIEEEREDGRIVVSYSVAGLEEIRTFVQGWGVGLTVLAPDVLVQRLRSESEILTQRYS